MYPWIFQYIIISESDKSFIQTLTGKDILWISALAWNSLNKNRNWKWKVSFYEITTHFWCLHLMLKFDGNLQLIKNKSSRFIFENYQVIYICFVMTNFCHDQNFQILQKLIYAFNLHWTIAKIPSVLKNSGLSQIQLCCPEVPIFDILSRIFKISLICPEPLYKFSCTVHHHISALRKT